ncbi:FAD-binding monooxygenase [Microbacterium bovistercoris]|uniref:FAD-binding monooxygenase n=1 Tax=Microbacterium bovistercoris TaxID=2293570 RepID=A0A371NX12_9MICO|nr:FAD-dependent monooxygenase [Microbacterium bovistercoris]REJ07695.1 FAD-binding monooxygenase [Microbacterium bovistercoris]
MSTTTPRVLVSGAGIAGLALALQLIRAGIRTTVVERAAAPRPGGQAVDLRGASREVAERMGLLPGIERRRVHEIGMSYVDARGRVFGRMSMADFDGNGAVAEIEIARGDLAEVLRESLAEADADAPGLLEVRYGDRITALEQHDDAVDVSFERAASERYDLVVGADGVHSATRRLAFGAEERFAHALGGYAAFFTLPTPADIEDGWFTMRFVPGIAFGIRPDRDPSTSKAILTIRADRNPALRGDRGTQQALISELLEGAGWHADTIIDAMADADDFYFDELVRIDLDSPVAGRVVLLGDAASCGSPMTGMGTATALIGAHLLAARIVARPDDLPGALAAYAADIAPFAEVGKKIPYGGIERMVPASRFGAAVSRMLVRVTLSKPFRPLMRRAFAAGGTELALPTVEMSEPVR